MAQQNALVHEKKKDLEICIRSSILSNTYIHTYDEKKLFLKDTH